MTVELGHFALVLALCVALVQGTLPLVGAARRDQRLMQLGDVAALVQLAAVAAAFFALMFAYIVSDFSVINVYQNSHSAKPLLYKVTGVWGNHEGSMVLWVLMLAAFGAAVALFGSNLPPTLRARVLGVQALIAVGFLAFILATSNPFLRLDPVPLDGTDLNPLLQDPGLAFHPPFLYLGYVGFSIAFSFAVAALLEGRVDPAWARWVRPWTLLAWASLTLGIGMGSWWAYYELGWGGWWFWDPVENASLMPWLSGTALLHSAIVVEKRDTLKRWTVLMAIITFSMSLLGTFLVRSGVLTSVHAFATDPSRGVFILGLFTLFTGGALVLYALRSHILAPGGVFQTVSRETALVMNNVFLSVILAAVFIGTLYPPFAKAVFDATLSVGPPYFNMVTVPLAALLLLFLVPGTLMPWKRGDLLAVARRLLPAVFATLAVLLVSIYLTWGGPVVALVGIAMGTWAIAGALADLSERLRLFRTPLTQSWNRAKGLPRAAWGTALAHGGLGVAILGMVGTSLLYDERIELMAMGERIEVGGYTLVFEGVEETRGPNYEALTGSLRVLKGGREIGVLTPERRWYPVAAMDTTEAAILPVAVSDLYVALGDPQGSRLDFSNPPEAGSAWVVRAYYHPLVHLLWGGALMMTLGGVVSLTDRRYRIGAPVRARAPRGPAPAPAPAE